MVRISASVVSPSRPALTPPALLTRKTAELLQREFERRFPALLRADVRGNEVNPPTASAKPFGRTAQNV
jgi:hypothetical protein